MNQLLAILFAPSILAGAIVLVIQFRSNMSGKSNL